MIQLPENQMPLQSKFLSHYNGSIRSIVTFSGLHRLINVCLSAHYFVDHVTREGEVVTTRDTDGSWGYQDNHTAEQRNNAFQMAETIKAELLSAGAYRVGNKYWIDIDGVPTKIAGMTANNTSINNK